MKTAKSLGISQEYVLSLLNQVKTDLLNLWIEAEYFSYVRFDDNAIMLDNGMVFFDHMTFKVTYLDYVFETDKLGITRAVARSVKASFRWDGVTIEQIDN